MLGLSLPSLPIRSAGGHPTPHGPGRILPRPHLALARLSGRQTRRHVVRTCVPASPCRRTNGSFGFGLILLKGKAANEGLSLKPFPAARLSRSSASWPGAANLMRLGRSIVCFSRGNPAELRSASGALLPGGEDVTQGKSLRGRRELGGSNGRSGGKGWTRASLWGTPKAPAEPGGERKCLALAGHEAKSAVQWAKSESEGVSPPSRLQKPPRGPATLFPATLPYQHHQKAHFIFPMSPTKSISGADTPRWAPQRDEGQALTFPASITWGVWAGQDARQSCPVRSWKRRGRGERHAGSREFFRN